MRAKSASSNGRDVSRPITSAPSAFESARIVKAMPVLPGNLLLRRLFERRAGIQCRRTPQITRLRLIVCPTAMHGAAIVPDDEIADLPLMAVDELFLRRVRRQIQQQ